MHHKTKGIVLSIIDYNDKYMLSRIFTSQFGLVTYMVPKSKGKNTKIKRNMFSLLAVLDMEVNHQTTRGIQRIKECRTELRLDSISCDISKMSIVFFIAEFLSKVLKEETGDSPQPLFNYLRNSIEILDATEKGVANFHLVFMLKLTHFLGFYPNLENYTKNAYFDLMNGEFSLRQPLHNHYISREESFMLSRLARITFENMRHFRFSGTDRTNVINRMLEYYRIHTHDFSHMKTLDVLHELF